MAFLRINVTILSAALLISGCSYGGDSLWPSLSGDEEETPAELSGIEEVPPVPQNYGPPPPQAVAPPPGVMPPPPPPPPPLGTTNFELAQPLPPGQPTGTFVGGKIVQMRNDLINLDRAISAHNVELQRIRGLTAQHSQAYHGLVAAIQSRLQVGTTPGNPILTQQWNESQTLIELLGNDIAQMNSLSNRATADAALVGFLLESSRAAYGLSGAIEEDHRQLSILEDNVNKTVVLVDRLLNELSEDIQRQTEYVSRERKNLHVMALSVKNGELYGGGLQNQAFLTAIEDGTTITSPGSASAVISTPSNRRPLVVIRFDRDDVDYQQALYTAVSRALERSPSAAFDLIAVTPASSSPAQASLNSSAARRSAEKVLRALSDMGLPAERVTLSAMTSGEAQSNEVRIYMR